MRIGYNIFQQLVANLYKLCRKLIIQHSKYLVFVSIIEPNKYAAIRILVYCLQLAETTAHYLWMNFSFFFIFLFELINWEQNTETIRLALIAFNAIRRAIQLIATTIWKTPSSPTYTYIYPLLLLLLYLLTVAIDEVSGT